MFGGGVVPADVEDDYRIETKGVFGEAKDYPNYLGTVLTMSRTTQFELQELKSCRSEILWQRNFFKNDKINIAGNGVAVQSSDFRNP